MFYINSNLKFQILPKHFLFFIFFSINSGCTKFLEIDPPRTELVSATVFTSNATATAAILGIYSSMSNYGFASGSVSSISYLAALASDELENFNLSASNQNLQQFNDNNIVSLNPNILSIWSDLYNYIYKANAILEGLPNSQGVSASTKSQLLGEAYFVRAFSYFYLVNLFGDVPLALSTNYQQNSNSPRVSVNDVYDQIILDLEEAKVLLSEDYTFSNFERVRPVKSTASALLARIYLFSEQWDKAETESSAVIANDNLFSLTNIDEAFLMNNAESIFQLASDNRNTNDASIYAATSNPTYALNTSLLNSFEIGDLRKSNWVIYDETNTFAFPYKYRALGDVPIEYSTILRLAEQYLIRAEARIHLNKISEGISDINAIRSRARGTQPGDLPPLSSDLPSDLALQAVINERRFEFFTEWGHRWLDLKRTNRSTAVLQPIKPLWQITDLLFPLPEQEILNNQDLKNSQNPGY